MPPSSKTKPTIQPPKKNHTVFFILGLAIIAGSIYGITKSGFLFSKPSSPPAITLSKEQILANAKKSIQINRLKDLTITKLVPGKTYELNQISQSFPFGSAFSFNLIFAPKVFAKSHADGQQAINDYPGGIVAFKRDYQKIFKANFNGATAENAFKWEFMNASSQTDWRVTDQSFNFLKKNPTLLKNFRGHCIFWNRRVHLPDHLKNATQEEIKKAVLKDRLAILKRYPQIQEWDLINEPIERPAYVKNGTDQMEIIFDPQKDLDFFGDLFKEARQINPQARYYVNENLLLSGKNTKPFIKFIKALIQKGARPDGIGIEAHFSSDYNPFTVETAQKNLQELASLGLPLKITELDFPLRSFLGSDDPETKRTQYLTEMLTLFYGTPEVEGIYFWGFADPVHWKGNEGAGLFDSELKIKTTGEEFQRLTQEEWITKEIKAAGDDGTISFRGFPGRYQIIDQLSKKKIKEEVLE